MKDERRHSETVVVGRVRKPHGVRGEVAVEVLSDVADRFAVGRELILRAVGAAAHPVRIESSRGQGEVLIVRFAGLESRDEAEPLRDALLEIEREAVPSAPEGSFYEYELTGCRLVDAAQGDLGTVLDVIADGGGWLLEVERGAARLLVPFVDAYLRRVDIAERRIEVDLPPELIALCTSTS